MKIVNEDMKVWLLDTLGKGKGQVCLENHEYKVGEREVAQKAVKTLSADLERYKHYAPLNLRSWGIYATP